MLVKDATQAEIDDIANKFDDLDQFIHAIVQGYIRGLIVEGDPGIGKTYGAAKIFDEWQAVDKSGIQRFEIIGGNLSTFYLYKKLYQFRRSGMAIMLDDCEIADTNGLNTLKHALDSGDKRIVQWYKSSSELKKEGIPDSFEFKAGIIYTTNARLDGDDKRSQHMAALVSRCHYLNMRLTDRQKLIRIDQVVTPMLAKYQLTEAEQDIILNFIVVHLNSLRELSLRTVTKIADLFVAFPERWERMAIASLTVEANHV